MRAWHELGTCRPRGMDVGPIPFTAAIAWADFNGLDVVAATQLWRVIRYLDNERAEREQADRDLEQARRKGR